MILFFERLNKQERLLYNATFVPDGMRTVVHELESELRDLQGEPYAVYAPVLDYQRVVPIFKKTLADPTDRGADEVVVVVRLFGFLRDEIQRKHIVALARDRDGSIRRAVVEALCRLGGPESVVVITQMLKTTRHAAAWGLIRLGEAAVPTIIEVLEQPPNEDDMSPVCIVRAYIDNWENVSKPVDKRIIKAVWEDMDYRQEHGGGCKSYHQQLLRLADAEVTGSEKTPDTAEGVLEGTVVGPDGKAVPDYKVELRGTKSTVFSESSNNKGAYKFSSVPAGLYRLICHPRGDNHPRITIEKVRIRQNETAAQYLSFERKYTFSGTVCYPDGQPAAGMEARGIWRWLGAKVGMEVFAETDSQGRYTLGAPFDVPVLDINVGGFGPDFRGPPQPYRNVEPGRTDIDFVLRKIESSDSG